MWCVCSVCVVEWCGEVCGVCGCGGVVWCGKVRCVCGGVVWWSGVVW